MATLLRQQLGQVVPAGRLDPQGSPGQPANHPGHQQLHSMSRPYPPTAHGHAPGAAHPLRPVILAAPPAGGGRGGTGGPSAGLPGRWTSTRTAGSFTEVLLGRMLKGAAGGGPPCLPYPPSGGPAAELRQALHRPGTASLPGSRSCTAAGAAAGAMGAAAASASAAAARGRLGRSTSDLRPSLLACATDGGPIVEPRASRPTSGTGGAARGARGGGQGGSGTPSARVTFDGLATEPRQLLHGTGRGHPHKGLSFLLRPGMGTAAVAAAACSGDTDAEAGAPALTSPPQPGQQVGQQPRGGAPGWSTHPQSSDLPGRHAHHSAHHSAHLISGDQTHQGVLERRLSQGCDALLINFPCAT